MATRKPKGLPPEVQGSLLKADAENQKAALDAAPAGPLSERARAARIRQKLDGANKAESAGEAEKPTGSSVGTKDAVEATTAKPGRDRKKKAGDSSANEISAAKTEAEAVAEGMKSPASQAAAAATAVPAMSGKDARRLENYSSLVTRLRAANQEIRRVDEKPFNPPQMTAEQAENLRRTMGTSRAEAETQARNAAKDARRVQDYPNRIVQLRDANKRIRELENRPQSAEPQGPPVGDLIGADKPKEKGDSGNFFRPIRGPAAAVGRRLSPLGGALKRGVVEGIRQTPNVLANAAVLGTGAGATVGTLGYGLMGARAGINAITGGDKKEEKKSSPAAPAQTGESGESNPAGTPQKTRAQTIGEKYFKPKSAPGNESGASIIRRMRGMA